MYKRILVPLENSPADAAILKHVSGLAKLLGAEVLLLHVADGWAARNMEQLNLRESQEMKDDRAYLERMSQELRNAGIEVDASTGSWGPGEGNRGDGRAGAGRFNRDGDPWALPAERRGSWHHRDSITTRQPDSDPDGARACSRDRRIALRRRSRASRRNSTFPL